VQQRPFVAPVRQETQHRKAPSLPGRGGGTMPRGREGQGGTWGKRVVPIGCKASLMRRRGGCCCVKTAILHACLHEQILTSSWRLRSNEGSLCRQDSIRPDYPESLPLAYPASSADVRRGPWCSSGSAATFVDRGIFFVYDIVKN